MALLDEINAACTPQEISEGNYHVIAAKVSAGRVKLVPMEVGTGTILEILGLASGNALLDVIYNSPDFKYVKPLVEQGRLRLDSAMVRLTLDALVPSVLTAEQANALKAHAEQPNPVSWQECASALGA